MKKVKFLRIACASILVLLIVFASLCSCSSKNYDAENNVGSYDKYYPGVDGSASDSVTGSNGGIGKLPTGGKDDPNAKIIKTANANISTLEYDSLIEALYVKISELEGYTDGEAFSGSSPYRYASITVRVPAARLDEFKNTLSELGTLTHYSATKQDVTLTYSTLTAKIETLTLEIDVVEELFEIARGEGDLDKIASIEKRLSDLRLDLADAEAQLSVYDNSIAYSTVYLKVNEIYEPVPVEVEEKGAFARIGENLVKNLSDIWNFIVEFFVWFVSALPYFAIIAVVAIGAVFVIKYIIKIRNNKKDRD